MSGNIHKNLTLVTSEGDGGLGDRVRDGTECPLNEPDGFITYLRNETCLREVIPYILNKDFSLSYSR